MGMVPKGNTDRLSRRIARMFEAGGEDRMRDFLTDVSCRSVLTSDLEPLKSVRGTVAFSFQQERPDSDYEAFSFPLTSIASSTRNIADAAVGLLSRDLIITVDCMMAHLAWALARPVWVLLKHEPDWRCFNQGTDTPWYPTMRLFRQPRKEDWRTPINQIASSLEAYLNKRTK